MNYADQTKFFYLTYQDILEHPHITELVWNSGALQGQHWPEQHWYIPETHTSFVFLTAMIPDRIRQVNRPAEIFPRYTTTKE